MKSSIAFSILLILGILQISHAEEQLEQFVPHREIVYKTIGGKELKLHLFSPKQNERNAARSAIIFFFGGGWIKGTPTQFYPQCAYLAERGMVAMSAEYRVKSRDGATPIECVKDAKSAIRWVRSNAADLGIDPKKIVLGGGSAGGHIAAAAAVTSRFQEKGDDTSISTTPAALVLFNPVIDNGPEGYGYSKVKDYWQDISPLHHISNATPPTILFLGKKDRLIPVKTVETFRDRMLLNERRCDLHLYEGQKHGFFNYTNQEHYKLTVEKMDQFLTSIGLLSTESNSL